MIYFFYGDEEFNISKEVKSFKDKLDKNFIEIVFDKTHNLLNIRTENVNQYTTITSILNMQELQAINKKVEELGWMK